MSAIKQTLDNLYEQSKYESANKESIPFEERMLAITKETGQFYNILLKTSNARRVLEVGTSTGYSTLWFADALTYNKTGNCEITTIERDSAKLKRCMKNFAAANVKDMITVIHDNAADALRELQVKHIKNERMFDFAFIDADKENMVEYFELIFPMVRKGGIIAADNILFPERYRDFAAKYVNHVRAKSEMDSVTINVGNGEEISLKK